MRWGWPLLVYPPVVAVHLVMLAVGAPTAAVTKALLMAALLLGVLITALVTARSRLFTTGRSPLGRSSALLVVGLLAGGVVASWAGDVLLGPTFVVGLGSFALAHVLFLVAFNGPAASRRVPLWTLVYVPALVGLTVVLWPHLGELRVLVLGYGVLLTLTAMTSARVSGVAALGGALFLGSDALLACRLFLPGFASVFPDPWQDLAIMVLYCAGEGLIALGLLRRLAAEQPSRAV